MNLKAQIPNLLTLTNLFCGCLLVYFCALGINPKTWLQDPNLSIWFLVLIGISLLADLLDGMVARKLNVASPLGLQLDSLADMVTFGVFPGLLMVKLIQMSLGTDQSIIPFIGFMVTLFSALRLAKFNIDTSQISYFKGLATPSNGIFILGIYILSQSQPEFFMSNGLMIYIAISIISSYLLICNIPMFSFKVNTISLKESPAQIILIVTAIVLFILLQWSSLAYIILLYILLSIIFRKKIIHA